MCSLSATTEKLTPPETRAACIPTTTTPRREMEPYRTHALIPEIDAATLSWYCLSYNPSPGAIALLAANPDKVEWTSLCCNPSLDARLTALLATRKKYELSWSALSRNRSPAALEFLFAPENRANIDWRSCRATPRRPR